MEKIDDYSLSLSFSVFGNKDNWELSEDYADWELPDFADSFKITLENTTEGLRISDIAAATAQNSCAIAAAISVLAFFLLFIFCSFQGSISAAVNNIAITHIEFLLTVA